MIDAKQIKENLSEDDIIKIVISLGGELRQQTVDTLIFTSITYKKDADEHKAKLYYYIETCSFVEYHTGNETFDVYELVKRRAKILGYEYNFPRCVKYICGKIGIDFDYGNMFVKTNTYNWKSDLVQFVKGAKRTTTFDKKYKDDVLLQFDNLYHLSWLNDNITFDTMDKYNIKYYKYKNAVVIPCRDIDGNIIGIRGRFFGKEDIKYLPITTLNGTSYKFPTNEFLYGIDKTKVGIRQHKKCLLVEAEKSVLQADGYFGEDNFTVALFGKAFSKKKLNTILELGVDEIIIGLDFDYLEVGDNESFNTFRDNVLKIADMCKGYCKVSALVSYQGHHLKDSPTDNGKDFYLNLYKEREVIYE